MSGNRMMVLERFASGYIGSVGRRLLRLLPDAQVGRVLAGPLRGTKWIVGAGTFACLFGLYEREKLSLFESFLSRGAVVYDIGAHAGLYTLLAASRVKGGGLVCAVEPNPRNLRYLRDHLAINGCENVEVFEAAMGERPGSGWLNVERGSYEGYLVPIRGDVRVRILTIDYVVACGDAPAPDLVKLDVEGSELEILMGALRTLREVRPVLFVAVHSTELKRECVALLRSFGYDVRRVSRQLWDELLATPMERSD